MLNLSYPSKFWPGGACKSFSQFQSLDEYCFSSQKIIFTKSGEFLSIKIPNSSPRQLMDGLVQLKGDEHRLISFRSRKSNTTFKIDSRILFARSSQKRTHPDEVIGMTTSSSKKRSNTEIVFVDHGKKSENSLSNKRRRVSWGNHSDQVDKMKMKPQRRRVSWGNHFDQVDKMKMKTQMLASHEDIEIIVDLSFYPFYHEFYGKNDYCKYDDYKKMPGNKEKNLPWRKPQFKVSNRIKEVSRMNCIIWLEKQMYTIVLTPINGILYRDFDGQLQSCLKSWDSSCRNEYFLAFLLFCEYSWVKFFEPSFPVIDYCQGEHVSSLIPIQEDNEMLAGICRSHAKRSRYDDLAHQLSFKDESKCKKRKRLCQVNPSLGPATYHDVGGVGLDLKRQHGIWPFKAKSSVPSHQLDVNLMQRSPVSLDSSFRNQGTDEATISNWACSKSSQDISENN